LSARAFTDFVAPKTLDEALRLLHEHGASARIVAGGTDIMVRVRRGMVPPGWTTLVSTRGIERLHGCRRRDNEIVVGASTTATDLIRDPVIAEHAPILARVADRMASAQIRNVATVGGNLVNASPAGDLINPLLLLDARLVLASLDGRRTVAVSDFFTGPGETLLGADELLVEACFDVPPNGRLFRFEKAGTRPAMECSVVTCGIAYTPLDGRIVDVRAAFGSVAATPFRGRETESVLEGRRLTPERIEQAARAAEGEISPISDVRGSAAYRRALVGVFVRRLLRD